MHASQKTSVYHGSRVAWRLAGLFVIGILALAACSPSSSGGSATATGAVPQTGGTSQASGTMAVTSAATGAATMASSGTMAATGMATSSGTMAATGAATMASGMGTGTPAAAGTAPTSVALTVKTSSSLGQYLADDKGMTLYTFANDASGVSNCSGQCATNWPPLMVAKGGQATLTGGGDSTKLGTITRADGSTQVTYNNQPLYYFVKDKAAGDTTGQGVGGSWFVAKP
jgi:predicted lipoprotein with Yx(FWY)xxD motif